MATEYIEDSKAALTPDEIIPDTLLSQTRTQLAQEVESALSRINDLRGLIADHSDIFKLTREDLSNSKSLRDSISEYSFYILMNEPKARQFEKQYESEAQRKIDEQQSERQSLNSEIMEKAKEIQKHNV